MINTKNNEERFKQILGEFDNDKNVLSCRDISPNSHKSVWWVFVMLKPKSVDKQ